MRWHSFPHTSANLTRVFVAVLQKLVIVSPLAQCFYLFGPPNPKPFSLLISWVPCVTYGFPGSYINILVLVSFVLAADDLDYGKSRAGCTAFRSI